MRAADAAKNTSGLIEGTVNKIKDGSDLVVTTNEAFSEVAVNASQVGELVGEIAAASQEQAQGIDQINKAVAEMEKVTQQVAANAEESASASEEMNAQAEQLSQISSILADIVDGSSDGVKTAIRNNRQWDKRKRGTSAIMKDRPIPQKDKRNSSRATASAGGRPVQGIIMKITRQGQSVVPLPGHKHLTKEVRNKMAESMNATDREGKYLTFSLGSEEYGIGIRKVKEIIGMMTITTVPQTPSYVKGVINLRGKVIPVVALRLKFGMGEIDCTDRTCIVCRRGWDGNRQRAHGHRCGYGLGSVEC